MDYRAKLDLEEGVRLVKIGREGSVADLCACCAPHPDFTGEIGILKVIDAISYKGGVRLTCKAGALAFRDYLLLHEGEKSLMHLYSAKRGETLAVAQKEHAELQALRGELSQIKKKLALLQMERHEIGSAVAAFLPAVGFDELRECANALKEEGRPLRLLFSCQGGEDWIWVASSDGEDTRPVVKHLQQNFAAKGGGKPDWAQGKLTASEKDSLLASLSSFL